VDRADWAPSPADVGAVIRARTKTSVGDEPGTFNSNTRPTGDQCWDLIDTAMSDIAAEMGDIPDLVQDNARRVAALGAACLVELSFYPEQINSGRSPYPQIKAWYDAAFARLKMQVANANDDGVIEDDTDLMAESSFPDVDPCDPNAIVGWSSRW